MDKQTLTLTHQMKMAERLIAMRTDLLKMAINRYQLRLDEAEDIYGDTCVYMLERGHQLLNMDDCFDAAITNTMKRRTLNHIRDERRYDYRLMDMWLYREHLADPTDVHAECDLEIDQSVMKADLKQRYHKPQEHALIDQLFDADLSITQLAAQHDVSKHTLHGTARRMRAYLRRHYG